MPKASLEPRALDEEVDFILRNANRFLARDPSRSDIKAVFAGQRPLVHPGGTKTDSKSISRSHEVFVSSSGLVSIVGGKWTTYRKMAEDTLTQVIAVGQFAETACITETLPIHGAIDRDDATLPHDDAKRMYGSDWQEVESLAKEDPSLATPLHEDLPYSGLEILYAARREMARSVEDALSRRTRCLLLNAQASIEVSGRVASILAKELGRNEAWEHEQVEVYRELANGYML